MKVKAKGFIDSKVLLGAGSYETKIDYTTSRKRLGQNCRPGLIVLYSLTERHGITQCNDFGCFRPWPAITKPITVRVMDSTKVPTQNDKSIVRLIKVPNVRVNNSIFARISTDYLFYLDRQHTGSQSQYSFS